MPAYNPPKRNEAFNFRACVEDFANPGSFKSSPTIAAGDWKISKDGGAFANLATLPVVEPASSVSISFELSSTEMDADEVLIVGIDQTAPKEWSDYAITILTTA